MTSLNRLFCSPSAFETVSNAPQGISRKTRFDSDDEDGDGDGDGDDDEAAAPAAKKARVEPSGGSAGAAGAGGARAPFEAAATFSDKREGFVFRVRRGTIPDRARRAVPPSYMCHRGYAHARVPSEGQAYGGPTFERAELLQPKVEEFRSGRELKRAES